MRKRARRAGSTSQPLAAAAFLAHPLPMLVVDAAFRVVMANAAAGDLLGARAGSKLGAVIVDAHSAAGGVRSTFRGMVRNAVGGETARHRAFVLGTGASGEPADLHLIAFAAPFEWGGARHALLTFADANALISDPDIVQVCEACGRVRDEEGQWHPLHRYLEDRLGLEVGGPLCDSCEAKSAP